MANPKYEPTDKHIATAETLAGQGSSKVEIAKALGISRATFFRHSETFRNALKRGREKWFDDSVTADIELIGLKKLVLGFEYTETTTEEKFNRFGVLHETTKYVTKYFPPNPASVAFALINRNPERWQNVNDTGRDSGLNSDELRAIAAGFTAADSDTIALPTKPPDLIPPGPPIPSIKRGPPIQKNPPGKKKTILRISKPT